jgi:hypothetical protein
MSPSIRLLLRHRGAVRAVREVGKCDSFGHQRHPSPLHPQPPAPTTSQAKIINKSSQSLMLRAMTRTAAFRSGYPRSVGLPALRPAIWASLAGGEGGGLGIGPWAP